MTLQTDIETAVANITAARDIIVADKTTLHGIVHGPATGTGSTVTTDAGTVKSIAKVIADAQADLSVIGGTYATVAGETGVLYPAYPVGDCRRYGVFPDQQWQNSNALLDFYHASNTGFVNFEVSYASRMTACYANSCLSGVVLTWRAGYYGTSINLSSTYSGCKMHFEPGAEFGGLLHLIGSDTDGGATLSRGRFTGLLTTYDRVGTINLIDSYIEAIRCKSDASKNTLGGTINRGVHLYLGTKGVTIGEIEIDNAGSTSNTDAALAIDGGGEKIERIKIGRCLISDSEFHGAYIQGSDITIGELIVRKWGSGTYPGGGRALSQLNATVSAELGGVVVHRAPRLKIGTLRIGDAQPTGRTNATHALRVFDTDHVATSTIEGFHIGTAVLRGVEKKGVSIGDRTLAAIQTHVVIDMLDVASLAALTSTYALVNVETNNNAVYPTTKLDAGRIMIRDAQTALGINVLPRAEVSIDLIDAMAGFNGPLLSITGRGRVGEIRGKYTGSSDASRKLVDVNASDGPVRIGKTRLECGQRNIVGVRLNSCTKVNVGAIDLYQARGHTLNGALELTSASHCEIERIDVTDTSGAVGLSINTCTNVRIGGGSIGASFSKGITGAGNTRCSATQLVSSGNTTNTDLASGQLVVDATCLNATL